LHIVSFVLFSKKCVKVILSVQNDLVFTLDLDDHR